MRKESLEGCKSARQARRLAPWAAVVVKVDGGYIAYESHEDARIAKGQV